VKSRYEGTRDGPHAIYYYPGSTSCYPQVTGQSSVPSVYAVEGKRLGRDWVVLSLDYERKRRPKQTKGGQQE
jgi:hypothetical protein